MPEFDDALRGYAFETMKRDGFRCRYCGLDGTESFSNWLALSEVHLLPKDHPDRNNREYIVCACSFCNTADNRFFEQAAARGLKFEGMSTEDLVEQRRPYVERARASYREFWEIHVNIRHQ